MKSAWKSTIQTAKAFRKKHYLKLKTSIQVGLNPKQSLSFALNVGTLFRINVGKKVALLLNADYFSTKPEFKDFEFSQKIGTISLGFGAAYRLK